MAETKKTKATPDMGVADMTAALLAINPVATNAWLEIMSESTRFLTDRLNQDIETQKALLACRSPAELLQVQSEFFQSAMNQYAEEIARLSEMVTRGAEDTIEDAVSGHSREYDDVPI
ncbi:MAG: phasin family protein [Paracoccaceae bacterium]|nr:phasin family protein [Paracoccaceae bacterium]